MYLDKYTNPMDLMLKDFWDQLPWYFWVVGLVQETSGRTRILSSSFLTFLPDITAPNGLHFGDPVGHKIHLARRGTPSFSQFSQGRYLSGHTKHRNDNISSIGIIQNTHPHSKSPTILFGDFNFLTGKLHQSFQIWESNMTTLGILLGVLLGVVSCKWTYWKPYQLSCILQIFSTYEYFSKQY